MLHRFAVPAILVPFWKVSHVAGETPRSPWSNLDIRNLRTLQEVASNECNEQLGEIALTEEIELARQVYDASIQVIQAASSESTVCSIFDNPPTCITDFSSAAGSQEFLEVCANQGYHAVLAELKVVCLENNMHFSVKGQSFFLVSIVTLRIFWRCSPWG